MMRICKKFLSVVLALIMSLALALTVAGCFHSKIGEDTLVIDVVFPGLSGMKPADQDIRVQPIHNIQNAPVGTAADDNGLAAFFYL